MERRHQWNVYRLPRVPLASLTESRSSLAEIFFSDLAGSLFAGYASSLPKSFALAAPSMEGVKELLSSKYFSSFGYIVALFHLPPLVIFSAYTGSLRTSERRTFSCPSSPDSQDDCLVKYDEHYNFPFPLYGYVLFCFIPPLAVCIAYLWCFVKSRVDEIEIALKPNPENPRPRPRLRARRVFYSSVSDICRLQTADHRLQTTGYRQHTMDLRP